MSEAYGITLRPVTHLRDAKGVIFTSEESGVKMMAALDGLTKISMTYQTDFTISYHKYIDDVDYVMMPSEFIARYYNLETPKNLYLGITKYDVPLKNSDTCNKYGLNPTAKRVTFMWPKQRDLSKMPIHIIDSLGDLGYQVLIKARGKDLVESKYRTKYEKAGHRFFSDDSWYPHTTQELIEISDLVINSGSTTIEECVMHNTPLINFDIKPQVRHGISREHRVTHDYLYKYPYCLDLKGLPKDFSTHMLAQMIQSLVTNSWEDEFTECRQRHLFDHSNTSEKVLNFLEESIFE